MPLFNKFTELQAGDLRNRLLRLGERTGFTARTILVMDGSKRSAHSNAFFAGFGKLRRIVLYDTLIDQLTPTQLEAVLAHEVGHYKLGHLPKTIAISAVCLFGSFAVMGWLVSSPWFVESFGFQYTSGQLAPILLLYVLLNNLVIFWLAPINNLLSRKHEYEADAFAKRAMGGDYKPLQQALRILTKKNLSNLTPHPLYSAFNYSHPTLVEREDALQKSV
ncbi:MAG: M48 family metallopeptidase [Verrucomicrobia bacterium]|nr:M48 family metallopeptidase [Verrucomicrobiota bacterium]